MAEQDLDRSEAATRYKLDKAREKGQVSKSSDVVSASVFIVAVVYLSARGMDTVLWQFQFDQTLMLKSWRMDPGGASLWPLIAGSLMSTLTLLAPFFVTLMIAALLANLAQTGIILSVDPIIADINRLNPVSGLKKVFSVRTLFDAARACVKLILLVGAAYYSLVALAPQFFNLAGLSALGYVHTLLADMASLGLKMSLILCFIALADLLFTRREFAKRMRMSKREIKDEAKSRDGDPRIRARMRDLRNEARKRSQSLQRTKNADVVLTNPAHFAVALRYVHGEMDSPQVIAKGAGHLAAAMRQVAARHNVPVVRSPSLARKLFKELELEHYVPPHMFVEVARIIVWVFALRDRHSAGGQERAAA